MRLLQHIVEAPRDCSYLPDMPAALEHRLLVDVSPGEFEAMLVRGWRRFGPDYFRPACPSCEACISTRIPVATFAPTKSQRRAYRACSELAMTIDRPTVDGERLELYHRWHAFREEARDWSAADLSPRAYYATFAFPHPAAIEVAYRDDAGALVAIAISDRTPSALSLVYFYYDPRWAKKSLGIANIVHHLAIAKASGVPYVYLGYAIEACASMRYKATFAPQEVLVGKPRDGESPLWVTRPSRPSPLARTPRSSSG